AFNATNTMRLTRGRWLDLFSDNNARIEVVYLEPPLDTILVQNRSRGEPVPEQVITKLAAKCEPPTWPECHTLLVSDMSNNGTR
ncbi:MAG: AAA family ATPase, partial [Planctomycetota bacterium]